MNRNDTGAGDLEGEGGERAGGRGEEEGGTSWPRYGGCCGERAGAPLLVLVAAAGGFLVYRRGKRKEWGWDVLAALGLPAG